MKITPTIRSHFSFKQFEEALQKLAHEIAIEAVKNLNQGKITIKTFASNQFSEVSVGKETFRFYLRHASYSSHNDRETWDNYWGFNVEEKLYLSSNHCTKISYYAGDDSKLAEKRTKKVMDFIDKLMEGVKPVPRFTLKGFAEQP